MRQRTVWLAGLAAGVLVWVAAPELRWPARLFTALLLGPAPVAFVMQAGFAQALPLPLPRLPVYFGTIAALWLLAVLAFVAASLSGFTPFLLGLNALPPLQLLLWTAFIMLAIGAIVIAFQAFGFHDDEIMRAITPVTRREQAVFVAVALSAGICEELTFRSFLVPALLVATGSLYAAIAFSAAAFGLLHAHQRAGGALRATLLGVVLAIPFVMTGSVYPSMIAHALVDVLAGTWLARWLLR